MIDSKNCLQELPIINCVTVGAANTPYYELTSPTVFIKTSPICLVFTQHAEMIENNLFYYICLTNNLDKAIHNLELEDILPKGVKFISTSIENGDYKLYKHCKHEILYKINVIEPNSSCKIDIKLKPITTGSKINSIEIIFRRNKITNYLVKHLVNKNPCRLCYKVKRIRYTRCSRYV